MKKAFSIRLFSFLYLTLFILFLIIGIAMIFFDDKQICGIQYLITSFMFGYITLLIKKNHHIIISNLQIQLRLSSLLVVSVLCLSLHNNPFVNIALFVIVLILFISLLRDIRRHIKHEWREHI